MSAIENTSALRASFCLHSDEYGRFERVASPLSRRPDLHAFLLLDQLCPGTCDLIVASEHDEFYLGIEPEELVRAGVTEAQIIDLIRCGVRMGSDGLCMFA